MKLTVIITAFNHEKYIAQAVESILKQTLTNFKCIVINDGSTDNTGTILDHYAEQNSRLQIIHNAHSANSARSRNQGMQLAETEWVAFMDGDDVSYPQRLEKQVSFLQQYPEQSLCAVGSRIKYINETGEIIAGENGTGPTTLQAFKELNQKDKNVIVGIFHSTAIIHRETFYQVGGYREIHTPCSDMDLYARLGETGKAILTVPECLVMYRVHSNALSIDKAFDLRKKHHFTIENTQRRRAGQTELSWEAFLKTRWQKPWYRYPKRRTDWGIILYKKAGLYYGKRRFFRMMGTLFMALLIAPEHVAKRVILQIRTLWH